jgi:hypothetical protein
VVEKLLLKKNVGTTISFLFASSYDAAIIFASSSFISPPINESLI